MGVLSMKTNMLKIIISLCVVGICLYGVYLYKIHKYKNEVKKIQIAEVKLEDIPDGEYDGTCDVGIIKASVNVRVKNHEIEDIKLVEHINGKGKKGEAVIEEVIKKQSLKVDTISGATNSSKVILKAIENAFEK